MFASITNNHGVTVVFSSDGTGHTWLNEDPNYARVLSIIRNTDQPQAVKAQHLRSMMVSAEERAKAAIEAANAKAAAERLAREVDFNETAPSSMALFNGVFYFNGQALDNDLSRRLVEAALQGYDATHIMNFMARVQQNPSFNVVNRLYTFLSKHNMPINSDGTFLAYKIVRNDYKDVYSGTMDNSVGRTLRVLRSKVDDDMDKTCSHGLHCCSKEYLPHYGSGTRDRVVIVAVAPEDVVAIPRDYNDAKMRCCGYKVVGELPNAAAAEIFSSMSVTDSAALRAAGVTMEDEYDHGRFSEVSDDDDTDDADEAIRWQVADEDAEAAVAFSTMYFIEDTITGEKIPADSADRRAFNRGEVDLFTFDPDIKAYIEVDADEVL